MSDWEKDAPGIYAYAIQSPPDWKPPEGIKPFDWKDYEIPETFAYSPKAKKAVFQNGERVCKVCGQPESTHHQFEPVQIPKNCQCNWQEWGNPEKIPDICEKFEPMSKEPDLCKNCEHLKECHQ